MTGPHELRTTPESIGPYRIQSVIGQGGMGVVYLGEHRASSERAAIKTVLLPREGLLSGLRREIHALQGIQHPGVVRILDQGVEQGIPWYAMEFLEGKTLATFIHRPWKNTERVPAAALATLAADATTTPIRRPPSGTTPPPARPHPDLPRRLAADGALDVALSIMLDLCETLAFLHGEGIIHRDIKPENIFLRDGGAPVLVDFGIAWQGRGAVGREVLDVAVSAGTVAYMAPEQIRGEIVDARADLYAVGCVLYEIVTGDPPFEGISPNDVMKEHLLTTPPRVSSIVDGVPQLLDDVIHRLLEKQPRRRLGHADDIAQALSTLGARRLGKPVAGRPKPYVYRPEIAGRGPALDVLTGCLKQARRGRGGAALVRGESGIGKTYLAMAVAREAVKRGFTVITGACAPVAASANDARTRASSLQPFVPFLEAVADRCVAAGPMLTAMLLGERGRVLAACAPFFDQLPGQEAAPDPPPLPAKAARERLLAALADTILIFAAQSPLLLVLDDLQWADELSLELLALLFGGRAGTAPLMIVGTYRAEETIAPLLALEAQPGITRVTLGRLDEASVDAMVADMLALDAPPKAFVAFLTRASDGNPFFVAEYLRTAVAEGLLRRSPRGRWEIAAQRGGDEAYERLPLPRSLHDLVVHHLAGLSPDGRRLALAASVLGREVSVEVLLSVVALPEDAAMDALRELSLRQILDEPAPGRVRFLHDKLREVAYAEIPEAERQALHLRAALSLEAHRADGHDFARLYPELAHHFARAGEAQKAIEYLEKAGAQALASFANREAAGFFRDLIALGEAALLGPGAARDPSSIVDIVRRRGLSDRDRLKLTRWERQLADAYHGLGDLRAMSHHAARALAFTGSPPPEDSRSWALRLLREIPIQAAHRLFPSSSLGSRDDLERDMLRERAQALVRLSKASYFGSDLRWVISSLWCVNEAERALATEHAPRAYASIGLLFGTNRLPALAQRYFALSRAAAERARDESALACSRSVEALSLIAGARWDEARAACSAAERITEKILDGHDLELLWTVTAMLEVSVGRFEAGARLFARLTQSARERGDAQHLLWSLLGTGIAMLRLGRLDEVERLIAEADGLLAASEDRSMHVQRAALAAQVHLHRGEMTKARKQAALALSMVNGRMPVNAQLLGYGAIAEVHLTHCEQVQRGHPREAARARNAAERALRPLFICALRSRLGAPLYYRLRGRARRLAGADRAAQAALDHALTLALELRMPYAEATGHLELARAALPSSAARAGHLDRAEALFESMGCRLDLAACRALR